MTEYKIICDRKVENTRTGEVKTFEGVAPFISGCAMERAIYKDHDKALEMLIKTIDRCATFDTKSKENNKRYSNVYELVYTQSKIRIVSRNVTAWE